MKDDNHHSRAEQAPSKASGFVKATRSEIGVELWLKHRGAFWLAYIIAMRARWREGFNAHGLGQGEAFLGDWEAIGLTRQEYRTAKQVLTKCRFATFEVTSKGTIGKLIDTRLFDTLAREANHQNNHQLTISQPSANHKRRIERKVRQERRGYGGNSRAAELEAKWNGKAK